MDRRTLLKYIAFHAFAIPQILSAKQVEELKHKNLVLIELKGGNDGLNTLIPYSNPLYYKYRPNIAIEEKDVLKLDENVGLHPSLKDIKDMFDLGEVSIYQGLGYENPNRSHFRSIDIWDTASKSNEYLSDGWLKSVPVPKNTNIKGIVLGGSNGPLNGFENGVIKIDDIDSFLNKSNKIQNNLYLSSQNQLLNHILQTEIEIKKSAQQLKNKVHKSKELKYDFEKNNFAKQMSIATKLINEKANIPYYKVSLSSFDTHLNQLPQHARLLGQLSSAINTMKKNLIESNQWKNTIIMTYSEFGRRVEENGSKGTDHGTAAPHFMIGGSVKGGIYGKYPSLDTLDKNGDFIYTSDFRDFYKSIVLS